MLTLGAAGAGAGSSCLQVHWEPPETDNGSPVLSYHVQYCTGLHSKAPSWLSGPQTAQTSCQVSCSPDGALQLMGY